MGLIKFLGLDKFVNFGRLFKIHGGFIGAMKQAYLTDDLKDGKLVGIDEFGNRYYENPKYTHPRDRWVDYSRKRWLDYDATQVPPQWHRWLVHATDKAPTADNPGHEQHRWLLKHEENLFGMTLDKQHKLYTPYNTTRPKVTAWMPQQKKQE